jgi:hypothetical protein
MMRVLQPATEEVLAEFEPAGGIGETGGRGRQIGVVYAPVIPPSTVNAVAVM